MSAVRPRSRSAGGWPGSPARHQVLVVTHLPQVAAFADQHLVVAKDTSGAVTTSGVRAVADTERSRELARMLAGLPDSDLGIAHAEELLAVAQTGEKRDGRALTRR